MSTYEVEHNVPADQSSTQSPPRRPDLSTFFSALEHVDTSGSRAPQNQHALPHPVDISAAFRTLANSFAMMQPGPDGSASTAQSETHEHHQDSQNELLSRLVEELLASAEDPPREVEGVSDDFLAGLDRVPKAKIKQEDSCPICGNPFLDDKYPLVVRLPCKGSHAYDLECITPWLKLNPTCPMDRQVLAKKKEEVKVEVDDEEDEGDMMYA